VGSWVRAQFVVTNDGRVKESSVEFPEVHNPAVKSRVIKYLAGCRYVPGRMAGLRVQTLMEYQGWFQ
jgi:hypothetical protein